MTLRTHEWNTHITNRMSREDGVYVTLAETAFYPHGGGQPCDLGQLGGIAVLDVNLEDGEVWHKLERSRSRMKCTVSWIGSEDLITCSSIQDSICYQQLH